MYLPPSRINTATIGQGIRTAPLTASWSLLAAERPSFEGVLVSYHVTPDQGMTCLYPDPAF